MKKLFLSLFLFGCFALCSFSSTAEFLSFDALKDYNIRLIGKEQGTSTYSGTYNGLQVKVIAADDHILKIILMFNFNGSGAERSAYAMETVNIASSLMAHKFESLTEAQDTLYKKLAAMNSEQDVDSFTLEGLRFACRNSNGIVNIRITQ